MYYGKEILNKKNNQENSKENDLKIKFSKAFHDLDTLRKDLRNVKGKNDLLNYTLNDKSNLKDI
jgi:hypothetical protein